MEVVNGSVWVDQRRELLVQVLGGRHHQSIEKSPAVPK